MLGWALRRLRKTSTKSPGRMRLPAPTSSSTGTARARSPGRSCSEKPCARAEVLIALPSAMSWTGTLPTTVEMLVAAPATGVVRWASRRPLAVIGSPAGSRATASTTVMACGSALATGATCTGASGLRPIISAITASSTARPIRATAAMRVNLSMEPSPVPIVRCRCRGRAGRPRRCGWEPASPTRRGWRCRAGRGGRHSRS